MVQTFPWPVTDDELVLNCLTTRGQKRCSDSRSITSGPPSNSDIAQRSRHFAFVPILLQKPKIE